jgi:hypothetical protein
MSILIVANFLLSCFPWCILYPVPVLIIGIAGISDSLFTATDATKKYAANKYGHVLLAPKWSLVVTCKVFTFDKSSDCTCFCCQERPNEKNKTAESKLKANGREGRRAAPYPRACLLTDGRAGHPRIHELRKLKTLQHHRILLRREQGQQQLTRGRGGSGRKGKASNAAAECDVRGQSRSVLSPPRGGGPSRDVAVPSLPSALVGLLPLFVLYSVASRPLFPRPRPGCYVQYSPHWSRSIGLARRIREPGRTSLSLHARGEC